MVREHFRNGRKLYRVSVRVFIVCLYSPVPVFACVHLCVSVCVLVHV